MSPEKIVFFISVAVVSLFLVIFFYRKMPKRLKSHKFVDEWRQIQKLCADKDQWRDAIVKADELLDKALKKKKYKGNSMGERLVAAQKKFEKNEEVWFAHKLRKKLESNSSAKVSQNDTKKALLGIGQGLKDIGAIKK